MVIRPNQVEASGGNLIYQVNRVAKQLSFACNRVRALPTETEQIGNNREFFFTQGNLICVTQQTLDCECQILDRSWKSCVNSCVEFDYGRAEGP